MIFLSRVQSEVNESHIHDMTKNNGRIFQNGGAKNGKHVFFIALKWRPMFRSQKANIQARVSERLSHVFNLSNSSVVFKCNNSFGKINATLLK